jgi:hypothetical protein
MEERERVQMRAKVRNGGGEGDNAEDVNCKVGKGRLYMGSSRAWLSVSKGALF